MLRMSTTILREYQKNLKRRIYESWNAGNRNVIAALPTGAGKTVIFSEIVAEMNTPTCVIAHRRELVGQMSLTLARSGIRHNIIAPGSVRREIIGLHVAEFGRAFFDPRAACAVAGVDTLIRRKIELAGWLPRVQLWVIDEAHHLLKSNKWGKAVSMFPNARGLGVTATPGRTDGAGLGIAAHGVMHALVIGENMRELINAGFLTDYKIFAPPSDLKLDGVNTTASGEYSHTGLVNVVRKSHLVGDVVQHYKRLAAGKLGITFVTDVQTAAETAAKFNAEGVPAEMICATTPDRLRIEILRRFKNREIMQLVNVDLFGEGFDLPALEVVSMARPTQSFGLYAQQFGRALRPMPGKKHALIIDHAGNVLRHGLPDAPRVWSLSPLDKRKSTRDPNIIPVRVCANCTAVYIRYLRECPYCGHYEPPRARSTPEYVDGSLIELDEVTLARMRTDIEAVDFSEETIAAQLRARHCPQIGILAAVKRHREKQRAQRELRAAIALWGGHNRAAGRSDDEGHRIFYFKFGVDVLSAQTLGARAAAELMKIIENSC